MFGYSLARVFVLFIILAYLREFVYLRVRDLKI
jgi:hypothetical protein